MKKIIFATLLMATIVINFSMAQNNVVAIANSEKQKQAAFQKIAASNIEKNADATKEINKKALKDFSGFYKNTNNVYWEILADGSVASYTINNKKGRRFYNEKGDFICDILSCQETDLPGDIKDLVKSSYSMDYHIISADEIKAGNQKFFFIYLENKTNFKKLKVCEG
jgi:hypothetical protein